MKVESEHINLVGLELFGVNLAVLCPPHVGVIASTSLWQHLSHKMGDTMLYHALHQSTPSTLLYLKLYIVNSALFYISKVFAIDTLLQYVILKHSSSL